MTAIVTGASGFIGRRLRDALLDEGVDVVSLRRSGSPESDRGRSLPIDYGDIDSLARAIADVRPEYLFHLAGATKGVTYGDFHRGNVLPTKNLLEALKKIGHAPKRFVLVSSLAAYGPSTIDRPHAENDPRNPIEFYGKSKLEAEEVVEALGDSLPWTIIRPGGVYGPGDVDYFEYFKLVHRGLNVFFGNRRRFMSVVYVEDVVAAILAAARSDAARSKGYFICDGEPVSFDAFQRCIIDASGRSARDIDLPEFLVSVAALGGELLTAIDGKPRLYNRQKAALGRQDAWTCAHALARTDFGYAPRIALREGVTRTFEWYRASRWL